jgi:cephalosporin hydroxylase
MDAIEEFERRNDDFVRRMAADEQMDCLTRRWFDVANGYEYSYHFSWLGRPVIQYPQDIVAVQELIWRVRPDLIIETGIAHGGSLILSASMLALLDYCDAAQAGEPMSPTTGIRKVVGIDIDIREHNRIALAAHPLAHKIETLQGSSTDPGIVARVADMAAAHQRVMVMLDSNHTHEHVLSELEAYGRLVSPGSYCIVFDTVIEQLPERATSNRPWHRGNSPQTALVEYLRRLGSEERTGADGGPLRFSVDDSIDRKLLITVAPGGYLKRV